MTYNSEASREARREKIRNKIVREREGIGAGAIAGVVIALLIAVGLTAWAMTADPPVARNDATNAPARTGQRASGPRVEIPVSAPTPKPE